MSDDFQPRKHDALVEPMFEALGGTQEEEGVSPKGSELESEGRSASGRSRQWLWGGALAFVLWLLSQAAG